MLNVVYRTLGCFLNSLLKFIDRKNSDESNNSDESMSLVPAILILLPTHIQLADAVSFGKNSEVN